MPFGRSWCGWGVGRRGMVGFTHPTVPIHPAVASIQIGLICFQMVGGAQESLPVQESAGIHQSPSARFLPPHSSVLLAVRLSARTFLAHHRRQQLLPEQYPIYRPSDELHARWQQFYSIVAAYVVRRKNLTRKLSYACLRKAFLSGLYRLFLARKQVLEEKPRRLATEGSGKPLPAPIYDLVSLKLVPFGTGKRKTLVILLY